jgi:hypothetical protein
MVLRITRGYCFGFLIAYIQGLFADDFRVSCGQEFYGAAPRGPILLCFFAGLGGFGPSFLVVFFRVNFPLFLVLLKNAFAQF